MFNLFLRKDIARAQALANDLEHYRAQLHYTAALGRERYQGKLSSPKGLLLCFGAGCLLSLYASRHGEGARSVINPLIVLAKNSLHEQASVSGH